ncbi:MAG: hypothetical protein A2508_10515 [Candidatus Lambdaproteobacteria bacterium RIFOXYD12_FULL_49_8]|uniref:Uncharacterized protein n=1 Tax=Candidatus Lambdaproteobacteria bacterium RIFOXYD2_FULL_50_16 TaxID=1817772 RepID=A0A1F6GEU6_9PROT|nr:MAG: hypothetical protein A2527_03360 [Candidatus Lambdaproteobacteria bacterium RIFOXYD2_FULL_50_16]OGG97862.1 MAG: hypothetical protein A2508_10515 [Candidatus Lambdaproteobacteria bacterium RIFOXYD12_FULL_49_8]
MGILKVVETIAASYDTKIKNSIEGEIYELENGIRVVISPCADPKYPNAEYVTITYPDGDEEAMIVDSKGNTLKQII